MHTLGMTAWDDAEKGRLQSAAEQWGFRGSQAGHYYDGGIKETERWEGCESNLWRDGKTF